MSSRWLWVLSRLTRRIWFRATLFSAAAVLTALVAIWLSPFIPLELPTRIGADAVDKILGIIASSMLTVTTFSLSTMVAAYSAATSNVTPRATTLLMEDSTTQNALATFLGSFLFSLVGIIALSTGAYGDRGRVVLFAVTIGVIVLIVATLLRWIDHLSRLGRLTETTQRVEQAMLAALRADRLRPRLGCRPLGLAEESVWSHAVYPTTIGYIQHIDSAALAEVANELGADIAIAARAGGFVATPNAIAHVAKRPNERQESAIRAAVTIGEVRSFEQDPRFGACVLAEIASRALSPGINDPGTAIDVIGRAVRVLAEACEPMNVPHGGRDLARVYAPDLSLDDLFADIFDPVARDGAAFVEVQLRVQKALLTLAQAGGSEVGASARRLAARALQFSEIGLVLDEDKRRVKAIADLVASTEAGGGA